MGKDAGTLESYASEEDLRLEIAKRLVANDIGDTQLLEFLNAERERFALSDARIKHVFVDELIRRRVYPEDTVEGNPNDVFTMVEGWGAYWHIWKGTLECPHCKADLRDHKMGPPGVRQIGMVDRGMDKVTHWVCPDCNGTWDREFTLKKPE